MHRLHTVLAEPSVQAHSAFGAWPLQKKAGSSIFKGRRIDGAQDYFLNASDAYLAPLAKWKAITPGIAYAAFAYGTRWSPTQVHVLKINPRQPGVNIIPVLADASQMGQRKPLKELTNFFPHVVAAINCAYFRVQPIEFPGILVGHVILNGTLVSASSRPLATLGIDADRRIHIARAKLEGSLRLPFRRSIPITSFNQLPTRRNGYFKFDDSFNEYLEKRGPWNEVIAFDHHWGTVAPPIEPGMVQVLIEQGRVQAISDTTALPIRTPESKVIVGPADLLKALRNPMRVEVDLKLGPAPWSKMQYALSGKPLLLKNGQQVDIWQPEGLPNAPELNKRFASRTAAGVTSEGQLILLSTEGSEYEGLTLTDLSMLLKGLGVVDGLNFDGGKSTQMILQGQTVNCRQEEFPLPAALCITYQK